jgi:prephenate dehydrogenase
MSPTESHPIIAIAGPGLLGGSLAMALKHSHPTAEVRLWARRPEAVAEIEALQLPAKATTSLSEAVTGAHWVILATPVAVMEHLATQIAQEDLGQNCLITDVGSVKGDLVHRLESRFEGTPARFIGSHPMAGSEKAGISAARADLFQGANCIVTPTPKTSAHDLERVSDFWRALGCRLLVMSPEEHDQKVARISHLPHLMAAVTTLAALRSDPEALFCAGGGFRDSTRVASGDPDLWTGIVRENKAAIAAGLRDGLDTLRELLEIVEGMDEGKLRDFLAEAKGLRDRLPTGAPHYGND